MALKIRWSEDALASLNELYDYLETDWNEKVLKTFSIKLEEKLKLISERPTLFKFSRRLQGTRECMLTKHTTIFLLKQMIIFILLPSGITARILDS